MNVVTDTHPLIWFLTGRTRRLSQTARRVFNAAEAGRSGLHIPAVVLMELVLLEQIGRIRLSYADLRAQLALRPTIQIEPLDAADVDEARALAALPDPFDRMIAGTAVRLGLPLLTADAKIGALPNVETVW